MGVVVDDARREGESVGVDRLPSGAHVAAHCGDASARDGQAAVPGRIAEAVDEERVADHEVVHGQG